VHMTVSLPVVHSETIDVRVLRGGQKDTGDHEWPMEEEERSHTHRESHLGQSAIRDSLWLRGA